MTYASSRYEGQGITISYNELSDCPITCMYKNMYITQQTNTPQNFQKESSKASAVLAILFCYHNHKEVWSFPSSSCPSFIKTL